MPAARTKSVSTKVTEEEYARLEALAGERTISEWARDVLLGAANPNPAEHAIMAELLALRTILLTLHFAVSHGQTFSAQEMRNLIEHADEGKLEKARQRLEDAARSVGHETAVGT